MPPPELSIVIPAFNEALRLPETLRKVKDFCVGLPVTSEVVIAVERSVDGTLQLAKEAAAGKGNFRVLDLQQHRGKGFAVRSGVLNAAGQIVIFMDADLSVPLDEVPVFLKFFAENPKIDVLVGSRKHAQSRILKRQSALRQRMGETFNFILRRVAGIQIRDTQCGFKAFRREAAQAIFSRQELDGFAFDAEVLILAERLGFQTVELPVQWINSPNSHVRIVTDSVRMLLDAIQVRRRVAARIRRDR